ncbi:hypothetical protein [Saccharophagus degradans]|uniref:Uncharacterized protein n=1 Tax=Saccharophagus degradans TaxID=86304 RepID=A0AAW7X6Y2_9GAMM|nr:hypothetical protein [Saccharophagus degradans]MDO6423314.1 hypothetical protein [Saccharophagus degradans]MDO6606719.1 hypothetical protein [Saccharophagus degradans]
MFGLHWALTVSALGVLGVYVAIGYVFYIRMTFQRAIDEKVMGNKYYDMGVLFSFNKLLMYGHYCLFSMRAKRDGVDVIFKQLPKVQRIHLIILWVLMIGSGGLAFTGAISHLYL